MPKKFKGENTKSSSARERKAAKANEERSTREKAVEDAYWQDDDKSLAKKNTRKEEKDKKQQEMLQRKLEQKNILELEEAADQTVNKPTAKTTRFQIQEKKSAAEAAAAKAAEEAALAQRNISSADGASVMENTNRMEDIVSATGVDAAVKALAVVSKAEAKAGRVRVNMAAAYKKYEENRLPSMKKENPSLKHSQILQRIKKEWQKSPENPVNQIDS